MAFVLKARLSAALFSITEAESAFFTWWDKTKQLAINGLLLFGKPLFKNKTNIFIRPHTSIYYITIS